MNRTVLLSLLLLLLFLGPCAAGCSEAGDESWYTPAPTPVMTIPHTPPPTSSPLPGEEMLEGVAGNTTAVFSAAAGLLP